MGLEPRLAETLARTGILAPGDAVLVGVSGGPDSVALLHLLTEAAPALALSLEVAHVDHGMRGPRGQEDAEFVRRMAAGLSLPFHLARLDLRGSGAGPSGERGAAGMGGRDPKTRAGRAGGTGNLEGRGRAARYRFFARVAAERRLGKVAVGHHRGDQVETMLMWLLRGCGPEGLAGMPAARPLDRGAGGRGSPLLIRPLLELSRGDILGYLAARGLEYREDPTNRDTRYLRNWLRRTVLPGLRERTDAGLDHRLARLGGLLRSDNALLDRWVAEVFPQVAREQGIDRSAFLGVAPELRPRVARLWLRRALGTLRRIGYVHVDAVLGLIAGSRPHARVSLPGGWTVVREYDSVRLVRTDSDLREKGYCYALPLEGEVEIPEAGVRVAARRTDSREPPRDGFEAAFDLARLARHRGEFRLRSPRPGDRLQPLGMTGHKKLKDLFIDKKVPRSRRRTLPLLVAGDTILWVPGCARSDAARLDAGTRTVWRVRLSRAPARTH